MDVIPSKPRIRRASEGRTEVKSRGIENRPYSPCSREVQRSISDQMCCQADSVGWRIRGIGWGSDTR